MSKVSARYVNWKVLFDGVEIPWISLSIGVGVDIVGQATVVIEPDPILNDMRPRTNVTILFYDNHDSGTDDLDKYKVYWEGEVEGFNYTKVAQGRSVTVTAEGSFSVFGRSKLFAHGFGPVPVTPHISGSLFYGAELLTVSQLFNFAIFGRAFDPKNSSESFKDNGAYGERLLSLMAFMSGYNANFRMQVIRTRLFSRIGSVPDVTVGRLVPRSLVAPYTQQMVESSLPPDASLLDVIGLFDQIAFHHYASLVAPHVSTTDKNTAVYLPGSTPDDSIYAIARPYRRNDFIFMPELYYAVPPSCNFIFPEFLQSLVVTRSFSLEPTRTMLMDENLQGGALAVVAPDEILRYERKRPDPAEFWSLNKDGIKVSGQVTSPYQSISTGGSSFNLFGAVTDHEIEKGILPHTEDLPFEYFSAVSNLYDTSKTSLDKLAPDIKTLEQMLPKIEKDVSRQTSYVYLMKALADSLLYMRRFRRAVTAELVGHRWLVPGFPCVIFDTMMSYIGYVRALTMSVSADGSESTSVSLDYVRTFPKTRSTYTEDRVELALKSFDNVSSAYSQFSAGSTNESNRAATNIASLRQSIVDKKAFDKTAKTQLLGTIRETVGLVSTDETRAKRMKWSREDVLKLQASVEAVLAKDPETGLTDEDQKILADAMSFTSGFYNDSTTQAKAASDSFDEFAVPKTPGVQSGPLMDSIHNADLKGLFPEDFFAPPVFGNMDFMSISKAEALYADLLGSQPALSYYDKGIRGFEVKQNTSSGVLALRLNSYNQFVNLTEALKKVFPIFGDEGTTEWSEQAKNTNRDSLSIRDWLEIKYLRRTGLMSLRQYIEKNLLKKEDRRSTTPVPQSFMVLMPSQDNGTGYRAQLRSDKTGEKLDWDNTNYSKIVDEFAISPRSYTMKESDGNAKKAPTKSSDSEIETLRKSVSNSFLTTKARQAFWLTYAQNHHGSRAFVGR